MLNKDTLTVSLKLFIITAVAALCLAVANTVTAPVIARNAKAAENEAMREVLPDADDFKKSDFTEGDIPDGAKSGVHIEALNVGLSGGSGIGYVVTAVSNAGYGGDIKVMVGLDNSLKVTHAKIMEASETAGLGANASKPSFIGQFDGKGGKLSVVKGKTEKDDEISAISGATITSRAVTSCINAALELVTSKTEKGFDSDKTAAVNEKLEETKKATDEQINGGAAEGGGEQ